MSLPRFAVNNPVLTNLCMWTILIGGVYSAATLVREMFPESSPNAVVISTPYPGATPAEIEKGISVKIEEAVKDIEEIDEINTTISEGLSSVLCILHNDVGDVDQVVSDIKSAIDTIPRDDFPDEMEETQVRKLEPNIPVINVSYFGDIGEARLKVVGRRLRDDLLLVPGITEVVLQGVRNDEISIEVLPEHVNAHGLSLPAIADVVAKANLDLPGGQVRTRDANVSVRTLGEQDHAKQIGEIIVSSDTSGKVVRLNEIANVRETFEDIDLRGRFNAKPTVMVTVLKNPRQDAIDISKKVKALVAGKMHQPLERDWLARLKNSLGIKSEIEQIYEEAWNSPYPAGGQLQTSTNLARFIEGRLDLLKRNGFWGLIFVFLSLLVFLNWRVALWVMVGLLLSIAGTIIMMKMMGQSLNLISMFGLIVVLGLLVDDAIIVGEHIFTRVEEGMAPKLAAITGAEAVTWPVVCAIVTTIVAFAPLLFVQGQIGDFMGVLPVIVMIALGVSLFEALSILPCHLAEWLKPFKQTEEDRHRASWTKPFRDFQHFMLKDMMIGGYERFLRVAVRYRYVTMSVLVGLLIVTLAMVVGRRVPFVYIQKMDSETLMASLKMPVGSPIDLSDQAIAVVERAVIEMGDELDSLFTLVGVQYTSEGRTAGNGTHLAQLIIELKTTEERDRDSEQILQDIRSRTRDIPGVNSLKFSAIQGGPGGDAVAIEISGRDLDHLKEVSNIIQAKLADYAGVFDIDDDFDEGRREVKIKLLDSARAIGMTTESLATQIRAAFYGFEARKIQRDREDVKIMVRYPESSRTRIADIESMWVAAPNGEIVPFREVARIEEGRAYATIRRFNQRRTVTVTADVDQAVGNAREVTADIATVFPDLQRRFQGVRIDFGGQSREFRKSFGSLKKDFLIGSMLIYVILVALFKSYVQPLIVMTAIPFGVIGAVAGHLLMGFPLTIMSLIGLVALTGIVVNDSLILVDWINHHRTAGVSTFEAVILSGRSRMRAILLTSITTILGLAPLLLETSFQARFLIPMGISIAAGVAFATCLTLVAIPSLYMILVDVQSIFRSLGKTLGFATSVSQGAGVNSPLRADEI